MEEREALSTLVRFLIPPLKINSVMHISSKELQLISQCAILFSFSPYLKIDEINGGKWRGLLPWGERLTG
jgi:hypothetical protein